MIDYNIHSTIVRGFIRENVLNRPSEWTAMAIPMCNIDSITFGAIDLSIDDEDFKRFTSKKKIL